MIKLQISMRKIDFVLTAAAAMMFAGCVNDDNVANVGGEVASQKDATIGFNLTVPGQLRGTLSGKDAATKLNNEFVVFGTKHMTNDEDGTATNDQNVFTNYKVTYKENSVGTSETNTHNWEYVGVTPYDEPKVSPKTESQTVKYWDYSASKGYTFTAFAAQGELANSRVTITKITADPATDGKSKYKKGYTVAATKDAKLDSIFYSDRVEVPVDNYGKPVTMTFRNFGSRVRVGFYETVPGYTVKIDTFYYDNDADKAVTTYSAMSDKSTSEFKAALWNVNKEPKTGEGESGKNTLTVTYYDASATAVTNQPTVTNTTCTYTPTLTLGSGLTSAALKTSSSEPTWDSTNGAYTTVFPNEGCNNPMLIRCDYTLTAEDGSNEVIKVKNARVVVPAEYMKWKPNFTYTYLFKISDKTNGTTGDNPSDPDKGDDNEGLHPITFDAVVVDATTGNQEYVATVSTNNVITYANGSQVTTNAEYKAGETIYVVNQSTKAGTDGKHSVIKPSSIGDAAGNARVYKLNKAATESEVYAQLNGAKMGITMDALSGSNAATIVDAVPLADGTNATIDAVKFTPATPAEGTETEYYAYVYTTTAYVAPEYESANDGTYDNSTVYYFKTSGDDGVYYTASGISAANFDKYKSQLYTVKSDKSGTVGVYDIKVITVKK